MQSIVLRLPPDPVLNAQPRFRFLSVSVSLCTSFISIIFVLNNVFSLLFGLLDLSLGVLPYNYCNVPFLGFTASEQLYWVPTPNNLSPILVVSNLSLMDV